MNKALYTISLWNLSVMLVPVFIVGVIYFRWSNDYKTTLVATVRMVLQLLGIGFVLTYIFEKEAPLVVVGILAFMILAAAWIAARQLVEKSLNNFFLILAALAIGCLPILLLVICFVLYVDPWYSPKIVIPLAGMIFANAMNALSIALERYHREIQHGDTHVEARNRSFQAALIPTINSFLAVGLVSLPGMMTGQILAGIDPLMAVRYQIMVMTMVFGASGIAVSVYFYIQKKFTMPALAD